MNFSFTIPVEYYGILESLKHKVFQGGSFEPIKSCHAVQRSEVEPGSASLTIDNFGRKVQDEKKGNGSFFNTNS